MGQFISNATYGYILMAILGIIIGIVLLITLFTRLKNIDDGIEELNKTNKKILEYYKRAHGILELEDVDQETTESNNKKNDSW